MMEWKTARWTRPVPPNDFFYYYIHKHHFFGTGLKVEARAGAPGRNGGLGASVSAISSKHREDSGIWESLSLAGRMSLVVGELSEEKH